MTFVKLNARLFGGLVIGIFVIVVMVPLLYLAYLGQISSEDVPTNLVRPFSFELRSGLGFLVVAGGLGLFYFAIFFRKKKKQ